MNDAHDLIVAIEQALSLYRLKTGLTVGAIHLDNSNANETAVTFSVVGSREIIITASAS